MDKKHYKISGGIACGSLVISEDGVIVPNPNIFQKEVSIPYSEISKVEYIEPTLFSFGKLIIHSNSFKDPKPKTITFSKLDKLKFQEVKKFIEDNLNNIEIGTDASLSPISLDKFISTIQFYDNTNKSYIVNYITGVPIYKKPEKNLTLLIEQDGIRLKKILSNDAKLEWSSIIKITAESRTQITRSASTGKAAIGLLIAGPFGALLGAGMGTKHDDSVNFISIIYRNEIGEEAVVLLQSNKAFEITTVINEARKGYLVMNNLVKDERKISGSSPDLDQLERLADLKDKGIITQEDFEAKKKQILGI